MSMKHLVGVVAVVAGVGAQAALLDRGNGLIYDTVQNLTWLQDANLAGKGTWSQADAWATSLTFAGASGWRLPTAGGVCDFQNGQPDCYKTAGPVAGASELATLWLELGNVPLDPTLPFFFPQPAGVGFTQSGPFIDLAGGFFWGSQPGDAFYLPEGVGGNFGIYAESSRLGMWAVHQGDVAAIPEPSTLALLLGGLGLMGATVRRKRRD